MHLVAYCIKSVSWFSPLKRCCKLYGLLCWVLLNLGRLVQQTTEYRGCGGGGHPDISHPLGLCRHFVCSCASLQKTKISKYVKNMIFFPPCIEPSISQGHLSWRVSCPPQGNEVKVNFSLISGHKYSVCCQKCPFGVSCLSIYKHKVWLTNPNTRSLSQTSFPCFSGRIFLGSDGLLDSFPFYILSSFHARVIVRVCPDPTFQAWF